MSATAKIRKKQIDTGKIINILVQGEHVAEEIIFQIEGEPSLVSSFSSLNFYLLYTRPGDDVPHILLLDGATLSEGIIYVPFVPTSYFTAVDGTVKIQLMASESSGLTVNQDGTIDGATIWETFPEFLFVASSQLNSTETIIEENVLTKYLSGTREQALKSEGYATGKQNGVAVGSDSPYYHNNSDYYRTLAATSAGNASTSEGNALIYKNQAQGSAEAAQASAESASASAAIIEAHATAIEAIADDLENIDDVAGDLTNINTVSGSINNVDTVAGSITNVNTVAGDKTNVDTVAGAISNVNSVSANIANINAVASNATNINAVNGNKTNIDTVAGKASEITTVAGKASEITTVAGKASEITTVAGIGSAVTAVAGKATEVGTVAGIASQVATVAGATSTIGTVVTNIEDINDVADDLTKITAVADDLANIDAVAGDLTNIDNAEANALKAEGWANGTQNGTPVSSDSPYYENNAKYWADAVPDLKNALEDSEQRIENLEQAVSGSLVQTNVLTDPPSMANVRTITNANTILPWALLNRVGARSTAWNQLRNHDQAPATETIGNVTFTKASNGVIHVQGTGPASLGLTSYLPLFSAIQGHMYLFCGGSAKVTFTVQNNGAFNWQTMNAPHIASAQSSGNAGSSSLSVASGVEVNEDVIIQIFDLTAMSEYDSNKTEAQNIASFKAKFPASYHPYNAGEIIPLNPSGFKVVGTNKYDQEWRNGVVNSVTGAINSSATNMMSKNFIPVEGGQTIYLYSGDDVKYAGIRFFFYDFDKNYISPSSNYYGNGDTCEVPSNASFMYFATYGTNITSYNKDIQICSDSLPTAVKQVFHDYEASTIDTSFTSDYKYINPNCHDYSENVLVDGQKMREEHRIVGSVDLGTLDWSSPITSANAYRMRSTDLRNLVKKPTDYSTVANIRCARYASISATDTYLEKIGIAIDVEGDVIVYDPSYNTNTSMDAFKTAMNGVILYYELATPSTPTLHDPIPNFPSEDGTTITAITPQTDLVNAIDVPNTIAYMTKAS